jgi:hypothetical protein
MLIPLRDYPTKSESIVKVLTIDSRPETHAGKILFSRFCPMITGSDSYNTIYVHKIRNISAFYLIAESGILD